MSLNDYFAASGAVYLRPPGPPLPPADCFSLPGLPKPSPTQKARSMATVSPLHQPLPPYETPFSPGRASSFAAALRKLAKQAGDPLPGEKDISPASSPVLGGVASKRVGAPPLFHHGSSPPVVTIAPSRPLATHTADSARKVMDLSSVPQGASGTTLSNGHLQDSLSNKAESSKRSAHSEKWEETNGKNMNSSVPSQVRPHATIAPLPRPDDSLTSSRGFQPYRGGEEPRNSLQPHHLPPLFEHPAYQYAPAAFLPPPPPHHLSHPVYRFDDPLYVDRYSLIRPPVLPGYVAPFYPTSRYDILAHSLSMGGHDRIKQQHEEERRIREKQEQELSKEQERRDREKREKHREDEHKKTISSSKRIESPIVKSTPSQHNAQNAVPNPAPISAPLNLVLQPSPDPPRKEAELWVPWQQPATSHSEQSSGKHSHSRTQSQESARQQTVKENEKVSLRFSPSIVAEARKPDGPAHEWRHERLQKACTNSHRRSHEAKKAKDAQKKVANGAVLKVTPPHEGMHARLIESEKTRIEMTLVRPPEPPPPPPPVREPPAPRLIPEPEVNVVSKLDLEAVRIASGRSIEDDVKSEHRLRNFLILSKVPKVEFDWNPQKIKFLQLLGLTTHFKRKKMELDLCLKRRRILKEDSDILPENPPSPVGRDSPLLAPPHAGAERLAEQLRAETTPVKLEFLFRMGLSPITLVKKEERERAHRAAAEERVRRHYRILAQENRKASPRRLFKPKSEAEQRLDHLRRLREMNAPAMEEENCSVPPRLVSSKLEQVPYPPQKSPRLSFKRGLSLKSDIEPENRFASIGTQADLGWANLETIMEALYLQQAVQSNEKAILIERCQLLRKSQETYKLEADTLSRHMSELLRTKRDLDEDRQQLELTLAHLQQCLRRLIT